MTMGIAGPVGVGEGDRRGCCNSGDRGGLQSGRGDECGGIGKGHAGEIGHGVGGLGGWDGVEEADAGRGNALGSGGRAIAQ